MHSDVNSFFGSELNKNILSDQTVKATYDLIFPIISAIIKLPK